MDAPSLTDAVRRELLAHPGVTEGAHRFGGMVFHVGGHEIGHLHGEDVADLPLPPEIREELLATGRLGPAHVERDSNWVSRRVQDPADIEEIVELFRVSYEHAAAQPARVPDRQEDAETAHDAHRPQSGTWRNVLGSPLRRMRGRSDRKR